MMKLINWLKTFVTRQPAAQENIEQMARWCEHVRNWYVPFQLQTISICAPFNAACEWQRDSMKIGMPIDKHALQLEFAALIKQMVAFNQYIKEEFFKWYVSAQGAEWKHRLEEQGMAQQYLATAKAILETATETTILACQQQAEDVICARELYQSDATEQTVQECSTENKIEVVPPDLNKVNG